MVYVGNFAADIDLKVEADSPQEAREKMRQLVGEYYENEISSVTNYLCISDECRFMTTEDGTEVNWN